MLPHATLDSSTHSNLHLLHHQSIREESNSLGLLSAFPRRHRSTPASPPNTLRPSVPPGAAAVPQPRQPSVSRRLATHWAERQHSPRNSPIFYFMFSLFRREFSSRFSLRLYFPFTVCLCIFPEFCFPVFFLCYLVLTGSMCLGGRRFTHSPPSPSAVPPASLHAAAISLPNPPRMLRRPIHELRGRPSWLLHSRLSYMNNSMMASVSPSVPL